MNRIFKISATVLAGVMALASCQQEPVLRLTEVGPEMNVTSCTEATYMGADIKFSVSINDDDFALSTLKAWLYYDETKVGDLTIRTKENGIYEGSIQAPLYKEIPDGTATLVFASQNVGMGLSYDTLSVELKRPDFDELTLKAEDGQTYRMVKVANTTDDKSDDYKYEVSGEFPEMLKSVIVTPAINDEGETITLGWDGSALVAGNETAIPFTAGLAGQYTISVDLWSLTALPLGATNIVTVEEYKQGQVVDFGDVVDLNNWTVDYDYLAVNDEFTEVTFRAVDGLYKFEYDVENQYVKVFPMKDNETHLILAEDGSGAPYVIGQNFGKPVIGPSWNTTEGAYPMAQISDKVYQFTLSVPKQLALSEARFKFYSEMGWGGEFKAANYTKVDIPGFSMDAESGDISAVDVKAGKSYKFTLDLTAGRSAAKLSCEEIIVPVNMLDIKVNGVAASKLSNTKYKVTSVNVEQNSVLQFVGIDNPLDYYVDPDHFAVTEEGLQFKAVSGYYSFELDLEGQYVTVRRVKEDGKAATYADEGVITIMGWGIAHPVMTSQLAWEAGALITLAEVEDGVYQFTGIAVEETDGETLGGRWRYDYLSAKLFGQAGWGAEQASDLNLTDEAKKYIKQSGGSNIEMADDVELEKGSTYVMTITDCTELVDNKFNCTIDFRKK